jgi:hypothetical protein
MRTARAAILAATLTLLLPACGNAPLIPDKTLNISPSLQIPYETVVATALVGFIAWQVLDPLAPTWDIRHTRQGPDQFEITLRQKRFATGGDGEARYLFRRHAQALATGHGYPDYTITSYEESVESGPVIGQRVSRGTIVLSHAAHSQLQ